VELGGWDTKTHEFLNEFYKGRQERRPSSTAGNPAAAERREPVLDGRRHNEEEEETQTLRLTKALSEKTGLLTSGEMTFCVLMYTFSAFLVFLLCLTVASPRFRAILFGARGYASPSPSASPKTSLFALRKGSRMLHG
jgi:hypothetical protein